MGFFTKMDFKEISDQKQKKQLLDKIESCSSSQLMHYQKAVEKITAESVFQEIEKIENQIRNVTVITKFGKNCDKA